MILRRVIAHVRQQEWTAIAIDFVIVVLGVFIGLQVQAFAVERERQKSERDYLTRLHGEIEQLLETRARYDRTRTEFSADLLRAVKLLNEEEGTTPLSPAECDAIAGSAHTTCRRRNCRQLQNCYQRAGSITCRLQRCAPQS